MTMASGTSRFTYAHYSNQLPVPKTTVPSFASSAGHRSQDYESQARSSAPVQDSQQDTTKSVLHLAAPPMPLSPTFLELSQSIRDEGLKGGMTPESS